MANDLLSLADMLEKKATSIKQAASQTAIDAALAIVGDLAYKTPVDTSKALSSWEVTLDAPSTNVPGAHFPGKGGSTYKASAAETLNSAKMILKNKTPGQAIYITNNQPYIKRLNEGHSGQRPAGFVERAELIGRKIIAKFKVKD